MPIGNECRGEGNLPTKTAGTLARALSLAWMMSDGRPLPRPLLTWDHRHRRAADRRRPDRSMLGDRAIPTPVRWLTC
jgi:hypothetical protein